MQINSKTQILLTLFASSFFLFACGKTQTTTPTTSPTAAMKPRLSKVTLTGSPVISLVPRTDGHELKLTVLSIPSEVSKIEYELTYVAVDGTTEIEKGLGDTILKIEGGKIERDLLLGTSSCTNGCKYKYDAGVKGGKLTLNFITTQNGVSTYESDFSLQTGAEYKKNIPTITSEKPNFTPKTNTEFVLGIKDFSGKIQVFSSNR